MFKLVISTINQAGRCLLLTLLFIYRYGVSPWLGNRCRFYPSCSHYAEEALRYYAVPKAIRLIIWRLLRCQPLHPGGYDPVPHPQNIK